jgi:DNA-binding CsgD family transcriptional regulator/GAF domain-containing protein
MTGPWQDMSLPRHELAGGLAVVRFAEALSASSSIDQIERTFLAHFGRLIGVRMYGFDLVDRTTGRVTHNVAANVSEIFVARYQRDIMDDDPLRAQALSTGRATYNMALMSAEEWLESRLYRGAYHMHDMRHVVEARVAGGEELVGSLHFASVDPRRDFTEHEIRLTEAVCQLLGGAIGGVQSRDRLHVEHAQAVAALELTGTAVVVSDPAAAELRLNQAARRLLADVVDAEAKVHRLIARPATEDGFSRRVEIELVVGGGGVLHGHSTPVRPGRSIVTVLELEREHPAIAAGVLTALTPRECEVAALVVDGLADREIAERLSLSHHTVSQYVKRIYRKLDVPSRVALTRLLLGPGRSVRRH